MDILITGATGKVGSRLVGRIAAQGHRVVALVRDRARAEAQLRARAPLGQSVELVEGDLLDAPSLASAVRSIEAVVHCAAFFRGATPEQAEAVNARGTELLAAAAAEAGVGRFLFTSTGLVYGPTGGRVVDEEQSCAPREAYPVSKLRAERALLARSGLDVRVLRLPFVYGDGDPHIEEVVPFMRGFAPSQRMAIAHHVDVAQAVLRVLEAPAPAHRIYNVAPDEAPTLTELLAAVGAQAPDGSSAERGRDFDALPDGRRLRAELGFTPRYPRLADAIAARVL